MKAFKTFIKSLEATQRSVKIKIQLNFCLRPGLGWEGLRGFSTQCCKNNCSENQELAITTKLVAKSI